MGLVSMTGFGRGAASARGVRVEVELSSVNRKQFDLHWVLPKALAAYESKASALVHKAVSRGAVTGAVRVSLSGAAARKSAFVDAELAGAYVRLLAGVARKLKLANDLTAGALLSLPEVVRFEGLEREPGHTWPLAEKALREALRRLLRMRAREGKAIEKDLRGRFARLARTAKDIRAHAPAVARAYRENLEKRLREAGVAGTLDEHQLLKEVAIFADKSDITEELVRLESHFGQVDKLFGGREPAGRPLDFLCQELLREINTVGSKANDVSISRRVIAFKAGLEAAREQVQNVE